MAVFRQGVFICSVVQRQTGDKRDVCTNEEPDVLCGSELFRQQFT